MILTLQSLQDTVRINISADQFKRLRNPQITDDEINEIADMCGCHFGLLKGYAEDLKQSICDMIELDGACDYSDHL